VFVTLALAPAGWAGQTTVTPAQTSSPPVTISAAERALAEGRLADALDDLGDCVPDDELACVIRGRVAVAKGDTAAAVQHFRRPLSAAPGGEAALELGLLLTRTGQSPEARPILEAVVAATGQRTDDAAALTRAGRALQGLGQARAANAHFRGALRASPDDPRIHTAWGELFLEKHNTAEAVRTFRDALKLDAKWVPARLGLAHALADSAPAEARRTAAEVLETAPKNVEARLLTATLDLDEDDRDGAKRLIDEVRDINPSSGEAAALAAAIATIEDRTEDASREIARAQRAGPARVDVYRIIGERLARQYRFDEAVAHLKKAVEIAPDNARAQATLGLHLLRTGDEDAARAALDRAFERDPFDIVTYNLLSMLDTLGGFETVRAGDLVVRLPPKDSALLKRYLIPLAEQALKTLSTRYQHRPEGPILVEVFSRHDDFAVRTLGLPGMIGALGACFGRVVTLDSPRARPPGTFNWMATLWHEMAHVVTLQMSRQRVPRWLSEGISTYEETRANPAWGAEGQFGFVEALARKEVLPIAELNAGFSDSRTIGRAYFQSSLVVAHIVEQYGEPALQAYVGAFGKGLDEEQALESALDVNMKGLQRGFDAWLAKRYGPVVSALVPVEADLPAAGAGVEALQRAAAAHAGSFRVQLTLGRRLIEAKAYDAAHEALERAATLVPFAGGPDSPRALLARLAIETDAPEEAVGHLEALLAHDHMSLEPVRQLLSLARERGDRPRLELAAKRLIEIAPFEADVHTALGRLALERGDLDDAVRELQAALDATPPDLAAAHTDLAEVHWMAGRPADTKRHAIAALEVAPRFERAQELLLKVVDGESPEKREPLDR
jgi:tetratricopeptide (TPR) repeat protein